MPLRPGKIYPGATQTIYGDFSDGCDPIDPDTSITLKLISPSGRITSFVLGESDAMQSVSAGRYSCDVVPDEPGRWHYQWVLVDVEAGTAIDEGNFLVQNTPFYDAGCGAYSS
jgi:hypothetical protein